MFLIKCIYVVLLADCFAGIAGIKNSKLTLDTDGAKQSNRWVQKGTDFYYEILFLIKKTELFKKCHKNKT